MSRRKTLRTRKRATQKVEENAPFLWSPMLGLVTKKSQKTLLFKRNLWKCDFSKWTARFWEPPRRAKKKRLFQWHYLRSPATEHETRIKQGRKRWGGNPDASRGPNSPSERAKWNQNPLLQHIYIYICRYMLESQFLYHVLAFREVVSVPWRVRNCTTFFGAIFAVQKSFFFFLRIFVLTFGPNSCFWGFPVFTQLVTFIFFIFLFLTSKNPSHKKLFLEKMQKVGLIKHYKYRGFWMVSFSAT